MIYRLVWGNPFYVFLLILFRHIHIITQAHTIHCRKVLYLNQITLLMLIPPPAPPPPPATADGYKETHLSVPGSS